MPPELPRPPTEFEQWQGTLTPRERRVDEIVQLMAAGRWAAGASHRLLAEQWGVHPGTVEHMAAEANRQIRLTFRHDRDPEARKDAVAMALQTFEAIKIRGLLDGTPAGLRVALEAAKTFGFYMGIEPAKNVRVRGDGDELDKLTDEQLEEVAAHGSSALRRFAQQRDVEREGHH